ncbi:MAG: hypothetical protein MHM6MM_009126, partial [Cercozoa sp. M6MM]
CLLQIEVEPTEDSDADGTADTKVDSGHTDLPVATGRNGDSDSVDQSQTEAQESVLPVPPLKLPTHVPAEPRVVPPCAFSARLPYTFSTPRYSMPTTTREYTQRGWLRVQQERVMREHLRCFLEDVSKKTPQLSRVRPYFQETTDFASPLDMYFALKADMESRLRQPYFGQVCADGFTELVGKAKDDFFYWLVQAQHSLRHGEESSARMPPRKRFTRHYLEILRNTRALPF